jgi:hypothetical protein
MDEGNRIVLKKGQRYWYRGIVPYVIKNGFSESLHMPYLLLDLKISIKVLNKNHPHKIMASSVKKILSRWQRIVGCVVTDI